MQYPWWHIEEILGGYSLPTNKNSPAISPREWLYYISSLHVIVIITVTPDSWSSSSSLQFIIFSSNLICKRDKTYCYQSSITSHVVIHLCVYTYWHVKEYQLQISKVCYERFFIAKKGVISLCFLMEDASIVSGQSPTRGYLPSTV